MLTKITTNFDRFEFLKGLFRPLPKILLKVATTTTTGTIDTLKNTTLTIANNNSTVSTTKTK